MTRVRIPPTLRAATNGQKLVELRGATVGDLIGALVASYPATRDVLIGADGEPNRFINLYLGEIDIRHLDGLATPVTDDATLTLLPAMAGGSVHAFIGDGRAPSAAASSSTGSQGRCSCPRRVRRD